MSDMENSASGGASSGILPVENITTRVLQVIVRPTEAQRAELAERFGLHAITGFEASFNVRRRKDGLVEVVGKLTSAVEQLSVSTLEPVAQEISEPILELFSEEQPENKKELDFDPLGETPEPIENGQLDLLDLAAQTLAVSLNPYPRDLGKSSDDALVYSVGDEEDDEGDNKVLPFADLASRLSDRAKRS